MFLTLTLTLTLTAKLTAARWRAVRVAGEAAAGRKHPAKAEILVVAGPPEPSSLKHSAPGGAFRRRHQPPARNVVASVDHPAICTHRRQLLLRPAICTLQLTRYSGLSRSVSDSSNVFAGVVVVVVVGLEQSALVRGISPHFNSCPVRAGARAPWQNSHGSRTRTRSSEMRAPRWRRRQRGCVRRCGLS